MSIISALDNASKTSLQLGENGHVEYAWSTDVRERILQLHFQIVRGADVEKIKEIFETIIENVHKMRDNSEEMFLHHMIILYKMICQTRDIIDGKGEYMLSYVLLTVWNKYYPKLAEEAFKHFVLPLEGNERKELEDKHPYGSWKDVKNLCHYLRNECIYGSSLETYAIYIINQQLFEDNNATDKSTISLAAKWVPREKSCHGDLYTDFATSYFHNYITSAREYNKISKAIRKAKMDYRKMVSNLNKIIDTVQIKQCANTWTTIDPAKQTSITMKKQIKAFLNVNKKGEMRSETNDRIVCANNFRNHIREASLGNAKINGKRVGINNFVKTAIELDEHLVDEITLLNIQWKDNSMQTDALGKVIAMVDVSGSMEGNPLYAAIGLGIRVAEKSMLGKRVMTFSAVPSWINLEDCNSFVEMVSKIQKAEWGMNTNFALALNMILDAIITQKMKPNDVEDMVLAVFSDMQFDQAGRNNSTIMDEIEKKYADAGIRLWGKPFNPPHILFWNLRPTDGFPSLSTKKNVSMMSGFSPALLNVFCEKGLSGLNSCNPWNLFLSSLDNPRYNFLEEVLRENI